MDYYAGLDVSLEETAICIVDENGEIVIETTAPSEPAAIGALSQGNASVICRAAQSAVGFAVIPIWSNLRRPRPRMTNA